MTVSSIPSSLAHNWVIPDGGVRIEVAPKGDPNDDANFVRFGEAVRKIAPKASP